MASSDLRRARQRRSRLAVLLATVVTIAACSHSTAPAKDFDDQKRVDVTCLDHQSGHPGTDYTGGADADTSKIFVMLHYYVANGSKPYCDGGHATDVDRSWAQLYVNLGGNPQLVNRILGSR